MNWLPQVNDLLKGKIDVGEEIELKGWVRSRRDSKAGFSFLNIHDGSCFDGIQVVLDKALSNYEDDVLKLSSGCSVAIVGTVVESQGKGQSVEIQASAIEVLGWVDDPETYPIAKKRHSFEYLRTVAHLRPRTNTFGAMTRLRNTCSQAIHRYFHEQQFCWVNTPLITASDCEGAGEMFRVSTLDLENLPRSENGGVDFSQDFFGGESFLTVSGQLNVEAYCLAMSRVYTFGPTFRAENSNTSRHLAEFWMVEPEIAFANLSDVAALSEDFLKYVFNAVLNEREDDMAFFAKMVDKEAIQRLENVVSSNFEQMEYSEAIRVLEGCKEKFEFPVSWGVDLHSEHERYLAEKHVGGPLVLMNYPKEIKAFYMRDNDDGKTCAAMDVLAPGIGEIIGGSQREDRIDILDQKMAAKGLSEGLGWYRDLRRYGTVPHGGFGLGFERLLNYISGMENIRDAIPYPRTPQNAQF
ncbi:asparagine--tRNA ligase [Gammaproteobacteria bacterium 45_16_T64]|nr:asparagine--tRNA ligase [Gammaproteobacteria bacterium 45_16_T64]